MNKKLGQSGLLEFFKSITIIYVALVPFGIAFGWYLKVSIAIGVQTGLIPVEALIEENKREIENHYDMLMVFRGVMNHYHPDVNRFFPKGKNFSSDYYNEYLAPAHTYELQEMMRQQNEGYVNVRETVPVY